uniref:Putative secreted protein n=1 Tax=Anopheles marajoara TaxID=58244 RepID=A0A2M4CF08_9DIPT
MLSSECFFFLFCSSEPICLAVGGLSGHAQMSFSFSITFIYSNRSRRMPELELCQLWFSPFSFPLLFSA